MCKQSFSKTVCIHFRTNTRLNIVIHLNITDAIFIHNTVDHFIGMGDHLRIPEIQLIAASVIYPSAMPFEKAVIT